MDKRSTAGKTWALVLASLTLVVTGLTTWRLMAVGPAAPASVAARPTAALPGRAPARVEDADLRPDDQPSVQPQVNRLPPVYRFEDCIRIDVVPALPEPVASPVQPAGYVAGPPRGTDRAAVRQPDRTVASGLERPASAAYPPVGRWSAQSRNGMTVAIQVSQPEEEPAPPPSPGGRQWSTERQLDMLQQRLDELETARIAHEDATRAVIKQSLEKRGSNINEFVVFGGTLEVETIWANDFDGVSESDIALATAELDFEIQVNDWTLGSMIFEYIDGLDVLFPTSTGDEAFVDRINVDTAFVTLGDTKRCPIFATAGRIIAPFGISTGDPVADVLTIDDPLTVEVFETKEDAILLGFEITSPRPVVRPPNTPEPQIVPVPVRPLVVKPVVYGVGQLANRMTCYAPIQPPPPTPNPPPPTSPGVIWSPERVLNGAVYVYNGDTTDGDEDHIEHVGGTLGYRARGIFCDICLPWSVDMDVDVNSSVFDSRFLGFEYRPFLEEIGYVPGMAAHVKSSLGPLALVAEWNGAIGHATFTDEAWDAVNEQVVPGNDIRIAPSAWQVSLAYQFGWNPTVEVVGAQGTYFAIGYSESYDLAGVTRVIVREVDGEEVGEETRVGFVPRRRFLVGFGEWFLDGLRVAVEYAHVVDYPENEGGTGNSADAVVGQLTYEW